MPKNSTINFSNFKYILKKYQYKIFLKLEKIK